MAYIYIPKNSHDIGKSPLNEDIFSTENADVPVSHVSLPGGEAYMDGMDMYGGPKSKSRYPYHAT